MYGHGRVSLKTLAERLPNSEMGQRLKKSGVLHLQRIVDRLEQFSKEPINVRTKLEGEVTLDRLAFHSVLCGANDGYESARQFLKVFQSDEEKLRLESQRFAAKRTAEEEIDAVIRSNQSLTTKVQECLIQIDEQDAQIKKLEQDLRDLRAEKERESKEAEFKLKNEVAALSGRHSSERDALMTLISLAETTRLQLEVEVASLENLKIVYSEKRDVQEEQLQNEVNKLKEEVEDWTNKYKDIEEQFRSSKQRIEDLEKAAVHTNIKHTDQAGPPPNPHPSNRLASARPDPSIQARAAAGGGRLRGT